MRAQGSSGTRANAGSQLSRTQASCSDFLVKEQVRQLLLVPAAGREGGGVEEQQDSGLPPSTATSGSLVAPPSVAG